MGESPADNPYLTTEHMLRSVGDTGERVVTISRRVVNEAADEIRELRAQLAKARADVIEEAAKVCRDEAELRRQRAVRPWPGDSTILPFNQSMVQNAMAINADTLANRIRSLAHGGDA